MKSARKTLLALVILVSLLAGAALLWQVDGLSSGAGVPASTIQHVWQHRLTRGTETFPINFLTFGLSDIWIRIKCVLDSLAASHKFRCNH